MDFSMISYILAGFCRDTGDSPRKNSRTKKSPRERAESVKNVVVDIRTDLQAALDRTRGNIATFGKLQSSKGNDPQRLIDLKSGIDNLLFELHKKWQYMIDLEKGIYELLFELDITWEDISESDKDAMRIELHRSESELFALKVDRHVMEEALKQTRRDISEVAEGRETMQELLAQKEMAIATLAELKKDTEVVRDAIYLKQKNMGFWLLPVSTFRCRSITSYMEEHIDVLRDELRLKEKAIAILENIIDILQVEHRRRTDMYDDENEDVRSIFTRSKWPIRHCRLEDFMHPYEFVNVLETSRMELDRSRRLQNDLKNSSVLAPHQTRRYIDELLKDTEGVRVNIDQTRRFQSKLENYSLLAPFQTRGGIDKLLKDTEHVRVKLGQVRRLRSEDLLDASYHTRRDIGDLVKDITAVRFKLYQIRMDMTEDLLDASYHTRRDIGDLVKDTTAVRFKLYQIRMDMTAGGAQAVCSEMVGHEKEMKVRVNKIHLTYGGKPTTSKDVQRYKTSVSFKGMSTEVLERQNYEKQSEEEEEEEEKEEEEEEFRAVEQMVMCKVCLDEDLCIIFLPCSHLATCERCASVLHSCPVCRSPIKESLKVNFE